MAASAVPVSSLGFIRRAWLVTVVDVAIGRPAGDCLRSARVEVVGRVRLDFVSKPGRPEQFLSRSDTQEQEAIPITQRFVEEIKLVRAAWTTIVWNWETSIAVNSNRIWTFPALSSGLLRVAEATNPSP